MKRGLYETDAVVLGSFDYGESDRILTFYTGGYGKVKGIAKGARRSRKRFVGNLEPASLIKLLFHCNEKSELVRVESAALEEGFPNLRADIEGYSEACYLIELVDVLTRPGQNPHGVYGLLVDFLTMLNRGDAAGPVSRFFEIKLLSLAGYMPRLGVCVACGEVMGRGDGDGGNNILFSPEKGGVLCGRCAVDGVGLIALTQGTARFLETAERMDASKLTRLKPGEHFVREAGELLDRFIKLQTGRELKTRKFISRLKNATY
ncbi:MAG: DNA repair protein RecO [Thermodesulfobacteriota bacterium]